MSSFAEKKYIIKPISIILNKITKNREITIDKFNKYMNVL